MVDQLKDPSLKGKETVFVYLYEVNSRDRWTAIFLSALIALTHLWLYGTNSSSPGIFQYDEFLTIDRTLGLIKTGDPWTIYTNCEPSWLKPPLHYYLCASAVLLGFPPIESARMLSGIFAVFSLWLVALLTLRIAPNTPWCAPAAALFCCSSIIFAVHSRSAMMETGYVFFILLAVYGVYRATEDSRCWIIWGLGCGLGMLHKAPMAWIVSLIWAFGLSYSGKLPRLRHLFKDNWFRAAFALNILLTVSWPLIQTFLYGPMYRRHIVSRWIFRMTRGMDHQENVGVRFDPSWILWLKNDSWLFWLVAVLLLAVALGGASRLKGKKFLLWLIAPALPVVVAFTFSGGPFYARYSLTFMPLFAVMTAIFLHELTRRPYVPVLVAVLAWFSTGQNLATAPYAGADKAPFELRAAGDRLVHYLQPDEVPVFMTQDDPKAFVFGLEGMTRPFHISDGVLEDTDTKYLVLTRTERISEIEDTWPGVVEKLEAVGRYSIMRLSPLIPAGARRSRRT